MSHAHSAGTLGRMVWGVQFKRKRIVAALALFGVAFYALLLPWHLTSQFNLHLHKADVGMFADAMCTTDGSNPATPATGCPICKGLAAFQLALAAPAAALLPVMPHAAPVLSIKADDVAGAAILTPRSRGPPLPA